MSWLDWGASGDDGEPTDPIPSGNPEGVDEDD